MAPDPLDPVAVAQALVRAGCPPNKANLMARQLIRRALMDADRQQITPQSALGRLLALMAQGWASTSR